MRRGGVHVVALGLADQRVEHGPGVASRELQADDQGVLVGPVQGLRVWKATMHRAHLAKSTRLAAAWVRGKRPGSPCCTHFAEEHTAISRHPLRHETISPLVA